MAEIKLKDMTEEQLVDLEAQIAELRKAKERKLLVWKPKHNEEYFGIDQEGNARCWNNQVQKMTDKDCSVGNCFPTKELAEAELERRKVIREIEELVDKYDIERGGAFVVGAYSYVFGYNARCDCVYIARLSSLIVNPLLPCFSSEEIAKRILKEVGKERVKLLFTKYPIIRGDE